jgi:hypothetical protein
MIAAHRGMKRSERSAHRIYCYCYCNFFSFFTIAACSHSDFSEQKAASGVQLVQSNNQFHYRRAVFSSQLNRAVFSSQLKFKVGNILAMLQHFLWRWSLRGGAPELFTMAVRHHGTI